MNDERRDLLDEALALLGRRVENDTTTSAEVNFLARAAGLVEQGPEGVRVTETLRARSSKIPDRTTVGPVYDKDGLRLRPGDEVFVRYGDDRIAAKIATEEVYVLHYLTTPESGASSRMLRHRTQAALDDMEATAAAPMLAAANDFIASFSQMIERAAGSGASLAPVLAEEIEAFREHFQEPTVTAEALRHAREALAKEHRLR